MPPFNQGQPPVRHEESEIEKILTGKTKEWSDYSNKINSAIKELNGLSGEDKKKAEISATSFLKNFLSVPETYGIGESALVFKDVIALISTFSSESRDSFLADPVIKNGLLRYYYDADSSPFNYNWVTQGSDVKFDNEIPELTSTEEFKNEYRKNLQQDIALALDKLEDPITFRTDAGFAEGMIKRLSKKYIDPTFIESPEVQAYLKKQVDFLISSTFAGYHYNGFDSYSLAVITEIKKNSLIKDHYFDSVEFKDNLLNAFKKWLDGEIRKKSTSEIKSFILACSQLVDQQELESVLREVQQ